VTIKPPPKSPEPPFSVRRPFLLLEEEGVTRLTLVRHAQQDYPSGEDYDPKQWDDPPLSGLGVTQAMAVSAILAEDSEVDVVACSTMRRAVDTAGIIAAPHGLQPVVRPELVEVQTFNQLDHGVDPRTLMSAEEWADREARFTRFVRWDDMPFGEGSAEFRSRAVAAVERLIADHPGKSIVLVSHGGVINAYLGWILGIEEDMFFLPSHCSITTVWAKGDIRRVHSINERNHLHVGILTN